MNAYFQSLKVLLVILVVHISPNLYAQESKESADFKIKPFLTYENNLIFINHPSQIWGKFATVNNIKLGLYFPKLNMDVSFGKGYRFIIWENELYGDFSIIDAYTTLAFSKFLWNAKRSEGNVMFAGLGVSTFRVFASEIVVLDTYSHLIQGGFSDRVFGILAEFGIKNRNASISINYLQPISNNSWDLMA